MLREGARERSVTGVDVGWTYQNWLLTVWNNALISVFVTGSSATFSSLCSMPWHRAQLWHAVHTGRVNIHNSGLQGLKCGTAERMRHGPSKMTLPHFMHGPYYGAQPFSFHEVCMEVKEAQTTWCMLFLHAFLVCFSLFFTFCSRSCAFLNLTWLLLQQRTLAIDQFTDWQALKWPLCLDSLPWVVVIFVSCGATVSMTFCSENMPIMFPFDFYRSISVPPLIHLSPIFSTYVKLKSLFSHFCCDFFIFLSSPSLLPSKHPCPASIIILTLLLDV